MDVSVLSKHGQRSLRSALKTSVLGDGLLERTRSTSLALLGATAAIGLTMVALALNQGWPLIAGAPIPGFRSEHQAVGKAAVVAKARGGRAAISAAAGQARPGVSLGKPRARRGGTALGGSRAPQTAGLVASHPTPASPTAGSPPGEAVPDPTPVAPKPAPTAARRRLPRRYRSPAPTPRPRARCLRPRRSPRSLRRLRRLATKATSTVMATRVTAVTARTAGTIRTRLDQARIPKRRPPLTKRLRQKPISPMNPTVGSHMRRHGVAVAATATVAGSSGRCTAG